MMENIAQKKHAKKKIIEKYPPLEEVIAYKNDKIIYKFLENFDVTYEEAADLFKETKKWLWLTRRPNKKQSLTIWGEMAMLDEMWHTFILFTKDYFEFCKHFFGHYLHHAPTTKSEKDATQKRFQEDRKGLLEDTKERMRQQMSYIYDELGEETVLKWYQIYPQKYSKQQIKTLRK